MDYDVFKELRVSEDDLHLSTKTQFCVNLVNNINGDFFENNKLQELLKQSSSTNTNINNPNIGIRPDSLFPNDRKNLDLKNRLRFVLFPEEFENNLLGDPLIVITKVIIESNCYFILLFIKNMRISTLLIVKIWLHIFLLL